MTTIQHATTLAANSAMPSVGAVACLAAVVVMLLLDRIPLSAYRPRHDDGRTRRPGRRRVRVEAAQVPDEPAATTVRRLDPRAITARPAHRRDELEGR